MAGIVTVGLARVYPEHAESRSNVHPFSYILCQTAVQFLSTRHPSRAMTGRPFPLQALLALNPATHPAVVVATTTSGPGRTCAM
jgi:hypothetical protein